VLHHVVGQLRGGQVDRRGYLWTSQAMQLTSAYNPYKTCKPIIPSNIFKHSQHTNPVAQSFSFLHTKSTLDQNKQWCQTRVEHHQYLCVVKIHALCRIESLITSQSTRRDPKVVVSKTLRNDVHLSNLGPAPLTPHPTCTQEGH
jgi:hypothetical protein